MLLLPDDDLGNADLAALLERPEQETVGLLSAVLRQQVVRLAEVDRVDLLDIDEVADVDRVRQLDVEAVEILVGELDEPSFLDLEAADDVVGIDVLARVSPHLVVADRRQIVLVEEVELELLGLGSRVHAHRHADEAERDRAAPDRACHGPQAVPEGGRVSTRPGGKTTCKEGSCPPKSFSTQRGVDSRAGLPARSRSGRGKGCGCCGEADDPLRQESAETSANLQSIHSLHR